MTLHLLNILPTTTLSYLTPFELFFNITPTYSHLRIFGCLYFPNLSATSSHKLAPCSTWCIFLSYPHDHRGHRCLDLSTHCIIVSRHVIFDESIFPSISLSPTMTDPNESSGPTHNSFSISPISVHGPTHSLAQLSNFQLPPSPFLSNHLPSPSPPARTSSSAPNAASPAAQAQPFLSPNHPSRPVPSPFSRPSPSRPTSPRPPSPASPSQPIPQVTHYHPLPNALPVSGPLSNIISPSEPDVDTCQSSDKPISSHSMTTRPKPVSSNLAPSLISLPLPPSPSPSPIAKSFVIQTGWQLWSLSSLLYTLMAHGT